MNQTSLSSSTAGLDSGLLSLREVADALGSSTTTLRKLIRQGRLPEAEKVKTPEGRIWAIPTGAVRGIGEREGLTVDLRDQTVTEPAGPVRADSVLEVETHDEIDLTSLVEADDGSTRKDSDSLGRSVASLEVIGEAAVSEPETTDPKSGGLVSAGRESAGRESTGLESAESQAVVSVPPTLAEVIDAAFLETLLGAKASEAGAMVMAERHRVEFDSLAARQLEVELRLAQTDDERRILAERLHNESLARAIADARVTELRDQLQREITYAEAERYERRLAVTREAAASQAAAELKSSLGWRARRRLARRAAD